MALLHERTRGRDSDPHAEQQLCEWLALGAGLLGMGLAKEFSASGLAVIMGYL